jgi:hypothetical protein
VTIHIKRTRSAIFAIGNAKLAWFAPKRWLTFNGLHGVISQKREVFNSHRCENLKSYTEKYMLQFTYLQHTTIVSIKSR